MPAKQIATQLLSVIKAPFSLYFELTIADPCREVSGSQCCGEKLKRRTQLGESTRPAMRFSFIELVRKQRAAISPKPLKDRRPVCSVRERYVREQYFTENTIVSEASPWLH